MKMNIAILVLGVFGSFAALACGGDEDARESTGDGGSTTDGGANDAAVEDSSFGDGGEDALPETSFPGDAGGPCTYQSFPGTCTVKEADDAPDDPTVCPPAPVMVRFEFVPDDPNAPSQYLLPDDTIQQEMVRAKGLRVGSSHPCTREEETQGTCTPLMFPFTDTCTE